MPLLTGRALALLGAAGGWLVLAAWFPAVELLFWIHAALVLVAITVDAIQVRQAVQQLEVQRDLPWRMGLGEPEVIAYRWWQRAGVPLQVMLQEAATQPDFPVEPRQLQFQTAPEPSGAVTLTMTPLARGVVTFPELRLRSRSPWGLTIWRERRPMQQQSQVLPGLRALQDLRLWARREAIPLGSRRLPRREEGTFFRELRPYAPGDAMRSIDWKASARRGSLIVRELEPERAQSLMLLIDCGRSMRVPVEGVMRLDAALSAALSLAWVAVERGDLVGAAAFGERLHTALLPRSGAGQMQQVMEQLGSLQPEGVEPDYVAQLAAIASLVRKRTLMVFFTEVQGRELSRDLLAGIRLLARRHLPVVVTLPDPRFPAILDASPTTEADLYHQAAAAEVVVERAGALQAIREAGGIVVDVPPGQLSGAVVRAYISIKARGRL